MSGLDDLLPGGGGGWSVPENSITLPPDAGPSDPRIYIGPDDPLATSVGQDAAIVLYFGVDRAFIISVDQSGSPDFGQFKVLSVDPTNGLCQLFDVDDDIAGSDVSLSIGANLTANGRVVIGNGAARNDMRAETQFQYDIEMGNPFTANPALIIDRDGRHYTKIQQGTELVTFAATTQHIRTVTFPAVFEAGFLPNVFVNIASGGGATRWWKAKCDAFTEADFRLIVETSDAARPAEAWAAVPVTWTAFVEG